MAVVLSLFMFYMIAVQTFGLDVGLGPGLSLKNGLLYLLMVLILSQYAVRRDFRLQLGGVFGAFALLIGYAVFSTAIIMMFLQYPGYKLMGAVIQLKGLPFDFLAFFFVFFYGLKTRRDVMTVLYTILGIAVLVNVVSGLDGIGAFTLDTINRGETDDRIQGIIGEHNQYGAYIAWFLPGIVAAAVATRGANRAFWVLGAMASFAVLLMTVSRGAFVACFGAAIICGYVFRRDLLTPRVIGWLGAAVVTAVVVMIGVALTTRYGAVMAERVFGQSTDMDLWQASSGRTELWADAFGQMMRTPITLLSGFGWATYFVLPSALPLAPHNTYLWYWFELGIVGLLAFIAILVQLVATAVRYANSTLGPDRAHLMAFAFGTTALAIAIFFVELYSPWPYFWSYAGVVMRLAMIAQDEHAAARAKPKSADSGRVSDRFGWAARVSHR